MKLWLGRHSHAGLPSPDPKKERERSLTPEGVAIAQAIARALVKAGEIPNAIYCSPYARAIQTADIYGKAFNLATGNGIRVSEVGDIAPDRPLEPALLNLMSKGQMKRLMVIGHMDNTTPAMQNFGGDWDDLVMGEVRRVKIDRKSGAWKLKFALKPSDVGMKDHTNK